MPNVQAPNCFLLTSKSVAPFKTPGANHFANLRGFTTTRAVDIPTEHRSATLRLRAPCRRRYDALDAGRGG